MGEQKSLPSHCSWHILPQKPGDKKAQCSFPRAQTPTPTISRNFIITFSTQISRSITIVFMQISKDPLFSRMLERLFHPKRPIRVANIFSVFWSRVHLLHTRTTKYQPRNSPAIEGTNASDILDGQAPYAYTSGRWLHWDKLQRDSRFVQFDFSALCQRVVDLCPEYDEIETCTKR